MSDDPDSVWNRAAATWWGAGGFVSGLLGVGVFMLLGYAVDSVRNRPAA